MKRFWLYGMNGVLNTVVSYVLFVLLAQFMDYRYAIVIAYSVAVVQSYVLNGTIVFGSSGSLALFICVSILLMLVNITVTWSFVEGLQVPKEIAQLPAIGVVYLLGYWINSRFVFRRTGTH